MLQARLQGRALLRVLYFAPFVLSEVVTGVVWTLMLQPGGLADARARPVDREWLADPSIVLYTRVRRDLLEVLRLPHDPLPRRAAADPARARGGRADRRRAAAGRSSAT